MKLLHRTFLFFVFYVVCSFASTAQVTTYDPFQDITLNPVKVQQFEKYVAWKHSYLPGSAFDAWKSSNTMLYTKEMWYYSESFYVKRDSFPTGVSYDEANFDVSRFESKRKANQTEVLVFDGVKDVVILLPESQLIYKPE